MKKNLLLLIGLFVTTAVFGQMPPGDCPGGVPALASTCDEACVLCDINGLIFHNDIPDLGEAPPGFCAPQLHNTQWVGFVAGSVNLTMEITPFACIQGEGLQIGIYSTLDCTSFSLVSNCEPAVPPGSPMAFTNTVPFEVGGIYFLVIDGNFGDVCQFSVNVTNGSATAPEVEGVPTILSAPSICPGGVFPFNAVGTTGASIYTWEVDGQTAGFENPIDLSFPASGSYTVCVTPSNPCNDGVQSCTTVSVEDLPPLVDNTSICEGESYTVGGQTFSTSGFYLVPTITPQGCPQNVELTLNVMPPVETDLQEEICQGEVFIVGGIPFLTTGLHIVPLTSSVGCDSTVNLDLTVNPVYFEILHEDICDGGSVTVGGTVYSEAGIYENPLISSDGCDSLVVLVLNVFEVPDPAFAEVTICEGDVYFLGASAFDQPGLYQAVLEAQGGCDSVTTVLLSISNPITDVDSIICPGEMVSIGTTEFTSSGSYTEILTSYLGCDSTVNLQLTVLGPIETLLVEEICDGETFTVGETSFSSSGMFQEVFVATNGCDSMVTLDLMVHPIPQTSLQETLCFGESFLVGDSTYTASGSYQTILVSAANCDSIVDLDLTIRDAVEIALTADICDGETYTVGATDFTTTGMYSEILTAANGCDSTVFLDLTVFDIPQTNLSINICDGETYSVGSSSYTANGMYTDILTAATGCDSVVLLDLMVITAFETFLTEAICTGQSFSVGTSSYASTGSYQDTLVASIGCDSIIYLDLSVTDALEEFLTTSICAGESFSVGGSTYTASGSYQDFFVTADGCDSIFNLDLTVFPTLETNLSESICAGESFSVGGSVYLASGTYQDVFTAVTSGCDSVVNLELTILDVPATNLLESICAGESYSVGSSLYALAGTYQDVLVAANGCDSIVNLDLSILNIPVSNLVESICDGESFTVGGSSYTLSGNYQDILIAASGCDSIVNLNLAVLNVPQTSLTALICDGESFTVGNSSYTNSGLYQDVLTAINGCDSIVSLNLTVAPIPVTGLEATICDGASFSVGGSTYTASGLYQDVLTSNVGCDSIVNLELLVTSFYQTNLVESLCGGESFAVGGSVYSSPGIYQDIFIAIDGCDSIVTLDLSVFPVPVTELVESICAGESFSVGSTNFTVSGLYQEIFSAATGCDSIVNLNLTVKPVFETNLVERICAGESFAVGNSSYTSSGLYQDVLPAFNGCDSIVNLDLFVNEIPQTALTEFICDGESFTVGSSTYTASGQYQDVLTAVSGCDSIVQLDLTVFDIPETFLAEAICDGESFAVGSSVYTGPGDYQDVLTSGSGCDSIVHLSLSVNEVYEVNLEEAICDGESFSVGSNSFSAGGAYQEVLTSAEGCDSIVNLLLMVFPCELNLSLEEEPAACNGDSDGSISFLLSVGTPPYSYDWQSLSNGISGSGSIADNDIVETIGNLPASDYGITLTDSYDIVEIVTASVGEPAAISIAFELSSYSIYHTSCAGEDDGFIDASVQGGTEPYSYQWNTGAQQQKIDLLVAGTYELTVSDQNGCMESITVTLEAPPPLEAELSVTDPACFGEEAGAIVVSSVSGGVGPYLFALEGRPFSSLPQFPSLRVGNYTVQVQDANGCLWEESANITQPEELILDLGEDLEIRLGDSVQLMALTSYTVETLIWESNAGLSCNDCPDPFTKPFITSTYTVTVIDENGCTDSDRITIFVSKPRDVFIPNAFSPNEDGLNDVLMVFSGTDVTEVKSFLVFNRWGETIIELHNFQPNDPAFGWDGTHRGQDLNTGVYVYFVEVKFIDGEVVLFKGDVVLMK